VQNFAVNLFRIIRENWIEWNSVEIETF